MIKRKEWIGFWLCIILLTCLTSIFLLYFRKEFHHQIIESEYRILDSEIASLSEEIEFRLLDRDLKLIDLGLTKITSSRQELIEQLVIESLILPNVFQVLAYETDGTPVYPRSDGQPLQLDIDFEPALLTQSPLHKHHQGSHFSYFLRINFLARSCILEVQIGEDFILNEWNLIDRHVIQQAALIIGVGFILLFFIFRYMSQVIQDRERQLKGKNQMLQRTNKKLAQAYKTVSLGALTGHLMHALKTPLTHLQIITREAESEKDIDPKELQSVQIQIKDLVTQTLNSLKEIEEQKKYFQITIKEILNSVIERTIKKFPHCNILLGNDPSLETKLDNLQSALLLPILTTLTENAFESKDQTSVELGSTLDGEKVIIIVSDTSGGISTREKEFLFDPSKSHKRGGTGLGLAIAQQLAQSMDAKLMLKKTDSNGSTFTVSFKC